MASMKEISKILVILGGIVGLLEGILGFLNIFSFGIGFGGADNLIGLVIVIVHIHLVDTWHGVYNIEGTH